VNIIFNWCSSLDCLYRLQAILQVLIVVAGLVGAAAGYAVYKIRGQITALQETKTRAELQATQSQLNRANDELAKLKTAQAPVNDRRATSVVVQVAGGVYSPGHLQRSFNSVHPL